MLYHRVAMELPSSFLSRLKILAKLDIASAPFSDKIRMSCSWVKRATDLKRYAAVQNGRGQGALLRLGAVKEGLLRASLRRNSIDLDQALYTILAEEWRERRVRSTLSVSRSVH